MRARRRRTDYFRTVIAHTCRPETTGTPGPLCSRIASHNVLRRSSPYDIHGAYKPVHLARVRTTLRRHGEGFYRTACKQTRARYGVLDALRHPLFRSRDAYQLSHTCPARGQPAKRTCETTTTSITRERGRENNWVCSDRYTRDTTLLLYLLFTICIFRPVESNTARCFLTGN